MKTLLHLLKQSLLTVVFCGISINGQAQILEEKPSLQVKEDKLEPVRPIEPIDPIDPKDTIPFDPEPIVRKHPNSQYSIGSVKGSFDVNGMGAATYKIPIEIPSGGGVDPQIAISYNSQSSSYGLLGYGFDVSGISAITRTGYNPFTDGVKKGISYTSSDNYCLDGKRLILKSGTQGQEGAIYTVEGDPYTLVYSHGAYSNSSANTWFEVKTPDGSVYIYGKTDNSRLSYTNSKGNARIASWNIEEAQDKLSNYITYSYTKLDYKLYPVSITYGTNKLKSRGIISRISFDYEKISNNPQCFSIEDRRGKIDRRIECITTTTNNQIFRKYTFKYDDSSDKSYGKFCRLTSVVVENGQGDKYVPTTISWNNLVSPTIRPQTLNVVTDFSTSYEPITSKSFLSVDLTGDGISDIVQLSYVEGKNGFQSGMYAYISTSRVDITTGKVSFDSSIMRRWYLGDFKSISALTNQYTGFSTSDIDGDGINDLLLQCYENWGDEDAYVVYYWIYGKDVKAGNTGNVIRYKKNLKSAKSDSPVTFSFDLNADGKDEICYVENSDYNGKYWGKIYSNIAIGKPVTESEFTFSLNSRPEKIFNADYNNDGLCDIIILYNGGYKIYFNNGGNNLSAIFTESNSLTGTSLKDFWRISQGDFNGDGLMDFVYYPGTGQLSIVFNNGDGTFSEPSTLSNLDICDRTDSKKDDDKFTIITEDFDGDGRTDVMTCTADFEKKGAWYEKKYYRYRSTKINWFYSTGNGLKLVNSYSKNREDDCYQRNLFTGDFDGDGMIEVANYGSPLNSTSTTFSDNQINIYKLTTGTAGLGKVYAISDGMAGNTKINYEYITRPSIYTKNAANNYPVNVYSMPLSVVSNITTENGSLGSQRVQFSYENLKIHVNGRGMLGFSSMTRNNTTLGEKQTTIVSEMNDTYWTPKQVVSNYTVGGKNSTVVTTSRSEKVGNNYFTYESKKEATDYDGNKVITETYYDLDKGVVTDQIVMTNGSNMYKETIYDGFVKEGNVWLPTIVTLTQQHPDDEDVYESVTKYTYDSKGNVLTEVIHSGTELALTKTNTYDIYGNILSSVNSGKDVIPITVYNVYDTSGRFISKKYQTPAAAVNTYVYDLWGNVTSESDETDPSNILTTLNTYDGWGKLLTTCLSDGSIKQYSYNWEDDYSSRKQYYVLESEGCLLKGTGFSSTQPWVKTWYDKAGYETEQNSIGPKNIAISKTTYYNVGGKVTKTINKYGKLSIQEFYSYDDFARITRDSLSTGKVISYSYESDGDGYHTVIINDNGRITKKTTDSWGNISSIYDAIGGSAEYIYFSNGKPKMVTSENATVEMTYDVAGNQTSLIDPDAGTMTYTYAADGTVIKETDGRGIETINTFDDLGRIVSTKIGDFVVTNVYGTSGTEKLRLVKQTAGANSVEFVHDKYGRIIQETKNIQGQSPLVYSYEYNNLNQISKAVYPNDLKIEYEYDQFGYKNKVKADGKIVYNLESCDGLTTKASFLGKITSSMTRDKDGFESNVSIIRDSTILDYFDEEFDPTTGNMLSRTRKGCLTELFEYDDMDRLVAAKKKNQSGTVSVATRIDYAKNGNITSKSDVGYYEYDDNFKPHAVVEINNDKGFLPTNTLSFVIHPIGKVQSISDDETKCNLNLTYGPDLQRCYSVFTRNGVSVRTTVFGGVYEKIIESGVTREFYYLDGNVIVIKKDGAFTPYLALTDNLGSYLAIVDSLGNKVFAANYDAWGKQSLSTTNTIKLHRGYCGHEMLNEFNLINMNGRLYSPYVGRFLSPDNYVQAPDNTQSFNRYSYCLNNPLKYVDPDGNWAGIDDLIAALVGGTINVCSNLMAGEVKDFWHGLSLFGVGAAAGEATLYGGPLAGSAVIGIGNSVVNQGFNNGWDKIDANQVGSDLLMSVMTSYLGGCLGNYLSKPLSQLTKGITNNILREAIKEALTNAASGFALGATFEAANGKDADFESVMNAGLKSGAQGLAIGTISGVGTGLNQNAVQKSNAKKQQAKPEVSQSEQQEGTYTVYMGLDQNREIRYVGITKREPQIRFKEHLRSRTEKATLNYVILPETGNFTCRKAHIMEQNYINKYGLQKNGGQLFNKINSISQKKWEKFGIK